MGATVSHLSSAQRTTFDCAWAIGRSTARSLICSGSSHRHPSHQQRTGLFEHSHLWSGLHSSARDRSKRNAGRGMHRHLLEMGNSLRRKSFGFGSRKCRRRQIVWLLLKLTPCGEEPLHKLKPRLISSMLAESIFKTFQPKNIKKTQGTVKMQRSLLNIAMITSEHCDDIRNHRECVLVGSLPGQERQCHRQGLSSPISPAELRLRRNPEHPVRLFSPSV